MTAIVCAAVVGVVFSFSFQLEDISAGSAGSNDEPLASTENEKEGFADPNEPASSEDPSDQTDADLADEGKDAQEDVPDSGGDEQKEEAEEPDAEAVLEPAEAAEPSERTEPVNKENQTIKTPQTLYGVAKNAKPFMLNATAKTHLTYECSNTSIATVSETGQVKARNTVGVAIITIRAQETGQYNAASKTVQVRVSAYKTTNGRMMHSQNNWDGKSGDSRGDESFICRYYYHKRWSHKSWCFIIRCTDPYISNNAAIAVKYIVGNKNFGYQACFPRNQKRVNRRASIYKVVRKTVGRNPTPQELKKIKKIKKKADTSCTPTLLAGYWLYIDMNTKLSLKWRKPYNKNAYKYYCGSVNVEYHQLEKAINQVNREYARKGMLKPFEIIYIPKSKRPSYFKRSNIKKHLKRGDIICSCPNPNQNGHTAMMQ